MFKILAIQPENGFFSGDLPSIFAPHRERGKLLAIIIIPNLAGMFNENRTFLRNFCFYRFLLNC
jgi:hypothetical protein